METVNEKKIASKEDRGKYPLYVPRHIAITTIHAPGSAEERTGTIIFFTVVERMMQSFSFKQTCTDRVEYSGERKATEKILGHYNA